MTKSKLFKVEKQEEIVLSQEEIDSALEVDQLSFE